MDGPGPKAFGRPLWYAAMVAAAVAAFLVIDAFGARLAAPEPAAAVKAAPGGKADALVHVLVALAAVVAVGQALGRVFARLGQPPVIGEVVGGILLGPSLLGRVAPGVYAFILPASVAPYLGVIAQLGVILYMFLVGLELNAGQLRGRAGATVTVAHAGIVCPFVLGSALALVLYPLLSSRDVPFTSFALFLGVALSVTAFPVLARILTDNGISRTELGVTALTCAAVADVTAWCLLALAVGVARAAVGGVLLTLLGSAAYLALLLVVVRPALARVLARHERGRLPPGVVALVFVGLLLSALATEAVGIHAVFGAFLFGAVIPHDSTIARELPRRLDEVVTVLFLPAFFALTGMRTEVGLLSGVGDWLLCGVIVLAATAGKFGGTLAAARLTGLGWRTAASLGVLMNTRGLMELVVLNVGLDLGVISPALFAMMVLMAVVTTVATAPVLHRLNPHLTRGSAGKAAGQPAGAPGA